MKCLGINLTKDEHDLYTENCKTLLRKIKDLNYEVKYYVYESEDSVLPKMICSSTQTLSKSQQGFL